MDSEEKVENIDHILDLLSRPISRYILSVLAGIDPGTFRGAIEKRDSDPVTEGDD